MSKVSIQECTDYSEKNLLNALNNTFESLGGIEKYIKPGTKVVLKPNLVMKKRPEEAATTHPELVRALIMLIEGAGGTVTIADSPGGLYSEKILKSIYSVCGMEAAVKGTKAALNYDLSEVDINNSQGMLLKKVTVIKPLVDADIIINLPKLKTHGQMVYTGAVKNMFGSVPGVLKAEYHFRQSDYNNFANALIDIFLSTRPTLNIMDAVIGMDGSGPTSGDAKHIGLILASENAFLLDRVALGIIDTDPMMVPMIKNAIGRGLCPESIDSIEVVGEKLNDHKIIDFNVPQLDTLKTIEFYDKGILKVFTRFLKPRPVFNTKLCIGCAHCAENCPPHIIQMENRKPTADLSRCIRCFCCQELCPAKAINIKRHFLVDFLVKSRKK